MIICIAGSPGSGKTTISRLLGNYFAKQLDKVVFHIEIDDLRHCIINETNVSESKSLWFELLINTIEFAQIKSDFVIIEGLFFDEKTIEKIKDLVKVDFFFLLVADLDICLLRNRNRSQKDEILAEEEVTQLYNLRRPRYFKRINSNKCTEQVLTDILLWLNIDLQL
jgi:uridine kinase